MNELICITTSEQGSDVVSARELHEFLESKQQFADWIKKRIAKCRLIENQDYTAVSLINETGGGRSIEYALTVDAAKHLAMIEGNDKGHQARQYFIEAEKALRQVLESPSQPLPTSTDTAIVQLLAQQTQVLAETQRVLVQLRADVDNIMLGQRPARNLPTQKPLTIGSPMSRTAKGSPLRQHVNHLINEYCGYHNVEPSETYNYLYKRLYDVYGVNVYRLIRAKGEVYLDAVERYGHLDRLLSLITAELHYSE